MTERERLIELMKDAETKVQKTLKEKISLDLTEWLGIYADYLLENGVIITPCEEAEKPLHKINHNSLCETETYKVDT